MNKSGVQQQKEIYGNLGHTFWGLINKQGFNQRILPQPKKWCEVPLLVYKLYNV